MYENQTYEKIKGDILSRITDIDKREGSFTNDMVTPLSMELEGTYNQLDVLLSSMFLSDTSGEMLEKRCDEYGIKRKLGTKSQGKIIFTGSPNAVIPKGSLVATNSNILFETVNEVTILTGEKEVTADIISVETGSKNNVSAGSILNIPSSINGVISIKNITQTHGGTDIEDDEALLKRLLHQLRNPATSGNPAHYKMWALEVDGIGDVKVFPTYNGNGTVLVLPITAEKQAPSEDVINNVKTHIETKKPIGATVTVQSPTMTAMNVSATITLDGTKSAEEVKKEYLKLFKKFITDDVFTAYVVDFYGCLSLFYKIPGVKSVNDFKLNGDNSNISIDELAIQTVGDVEVKEET